jgi:hypothetical protein
MMVHLELLPPAFALFFLKTEGASSLIYVQCTMEELGDHCKVVFALFVPDTTCMGGLVCVCVAVREGKRGYFLCTFSTLHTLFFSSNHSARTTLRWSPTSSMLWTIQQSGAKFKKYGDMMAICRKVMSPLSYYYILFRYKICM